MKEPPAPRPDAEQRPEEHDGIDALPPLSRPIHVLQSEPQREPVQRQRRADAVEQGCQARRPVEGATDPGADLGEPEIADAEEEENAPHQVMEVGAPDDDIVERALP